MACALLGFGGLGVTPSVALAYAVVASGFFAVEKFGASTATMSLEAISSEATSSDAEIPLAAPAE
jgi:adenine/guanine/hypoxanthine permease